MRDVAEQVDQWRREQSPVALATVIETWGSSPRGVGAKMAMTGGGDIAGSVSGGCVEGAVAEVGQRVLQDRSPQLLHFGVSDEEAWEVGLACGGEIDVFVEPLGDEHYRFQREAASAEEPVATLTVIEGPSELLGRKMSAKGNRGEDVLGAIADDLDEAALEALREGIQRSRSRRVVLREPGPEKEPVAAFIDVLPPSPTLVMVGGVHIAVALVELATTLGHRTIVIDPRRSFGSEERFPNVDRLMQAWPKDALSDLGINTTTAVAVLTHDPKIDDPALIASLPSPAFYVGALGSQRTQEKRRRRLREAGISEEDLARLHGPIGLDIGAKSPEEIALAIMAEIVAARRG